MVSKIFVFALIVGIASAATWHSDLPKKPKELANKKGCYIEEINDVVPVGTVVTPIGNCVRILCGSSFINYISCGVPGVDDSECQKIGGDVSKPYPACCPEIKC